MRMIVAALAAVLLTQGQAYAQSMAQAAPRSGLTKLLDAELSRFAGPGGPYKAGIYHQEHRHRRRSQRYAPTTISK